MMTTITHLCHPGSFEDEDSPLVPPPSVFVSPAPAVVAEAPVVPAPPIPAPNAEDDAPLVPPRAPEVDDGLNGKAIK